MFEFRPINPDLITLGMSDSSSRQENPTEYPVGGRIQTASVESALEWLRLELNRLKKENDDLLRENKQLREEATLIRLLRDVDLPLQDRPDDLLSALPPRARAFLLDLPDSFQFSEFFHLASRNDLNYATAKDFLRLFLRDRLLLQRGTRMVKPGVGNLNTRSRKYAGDSLPG